MLIAGVVNDLLYEMLEAWINTLIDDHGLELVRRRSVITKAARQQKGACWPIRQRLSKRRILGMKTSKGFQAVARVTVKLTTSKAVMRFSITRNMRPELPAIALSCAFRDGFRKEGTMNRVQNFLIGQHFHHHFGVMRPDGAYRVFD